MSTKFSMTRDINGYNGFGILPTYDIFAASLSATVLDSFMVPSNYQNWIAIFSYAPGASVWVSVNDTAAAPAGAFATSTSALNPSARQVKAGDVISVYTDDAFGPTVSVELQVIHNYTN